MPLPFFAESSTVLKPSKALRSSRESRSVLLRITKTFLSNELPVYALLPTVSYRKNYINLNRKTVPDNIANNGVAYIGAYQNKTKVFFLGSSGGQDVVSSVDLNTGALDNFVIDCGSW